MVSQRRVEANRENARKSTGPRTAKGKARSSVNALRHGLRAARPCAPGEDGRDFAAFAAGLLRELAPHGLLEEALAERIVVGLWRLARVGRLEAELLGAAGARAAVRDRLAAAAAGLGGVPAADIGALGPAFRQLSAENLPLTLTRYERSIEAGVLRNLELYERRRSRRRDAASRSA